MAAIRVEEYTAFDPEEILALYRSAGWTNYTNRPAMLEAAYRGSLKILAARDGDRLVGIVRMVGDGHTIIYIQDILVLPDYQGRGIGKGLLSAAVDQYKDVYQKVLLTDNRPQTIQFYERSGFTPADKLGCLAFVRFNP